MTTDGGGVSIGDIGSAASAAVALIALGVAIGGQRKASASERHAGRSADAAERMATALEQQALRTERSDPTPGVVWTLEHFQGDAYLLTNAGRAPAYDVHVDTGDMSIVRGTDRDKDIIGPDGFLKMMAIRTMGTLDDTITVTWADQPRGTERHSWARPLPPRPPRNR